MNKNLKRLFAVSGITLLLAGCIPSLSPEDSLTQETEESQEEVVMIPEVQLKESYYRTLLPFKKSPVQGLVVNNIYTKYDMKEAEEGLLRLSSQYYSTDDHFYQEGQYLSEDIVKQWLKRVSADEKGLNPASSNTGRDEQNPLFLAHIMEQNFLKRTSDDKVVVEGITIGLALNSVYYNLEGKEFPLTDAQVKAEGEKLANEIVKRMREELEIQNIPIVVGLFKQQPRNAIVPGTYFAVGKADKGKTSIGNWTAIQEEYVLLPTDNTIEKYRDVNMKFKNFKQEVDEYFPSFVNVVGKAFYKDGDMQQLTIRMPIQFFGTSELIGFTQHVTGLVQKHFSSTNVEVNITSTNGPEALIVKPAQSDEPFVHIYDY